MRPQHSVLWGRRAASWSPSPTCSAVWAMPRWSSGGVAEASQPHKEKESGSTAFLSMDTSITIRYVWSKVCFVASNRGRRDCSSMSLCFPRHPSSPLSLAQQPKSALRVAWPQTKSSNSYWTNSRWAGSWNRYSSTKCVLFMSLDSNLMDWLHCHEFGLDFLIWQTFFF